jgi:hypothetical protein
MKSNAFKTKDITKEKFGFHWGGNPFLTFTRNLGFKSPKITFFLKNSVVHQITKQKIYLLPTPPPPTHGL